VEKSDIVRRFVHGLPPVAEKTVRRIHFRLSQNREQSR
jgi:hypothetical protein